MQRGSEEPRTSTQRPHVSERGMVTCESARSPRDERGCGSEQPSRPTASNATAHPPATT